MKNNQLEPAYLRYIYDGLVKGSIHPENAAELPEGIIGLYEEAFDENHPVQKRQQLLHRFAIWALLKKEVSASFVAEILNDSEEEIQDFISTYSSWFNSPESGKYQLYHERLKVYFLQKLSDTELRLLNEKLISRLEKSIEKQNSDEFECYALEFLSAHLSVVAMLTGEGKQLMNVSYSQNNWQRQLKISNGYTWTKNGLKEVMLWASKHDKDEVIECGLYMIELHHQEQNAAKDIFEFIEGDLIELAINRLAYFGDQSLLGRKRKVGMAFMMIKSMVNSHVKNIETYLEKILQQLSEIDYKGIELIDLLGGDMIRSVRKILESKSIAIPLLLQFKEEEIQSEHTIALERHQEVLQQMLIEFAEKDVEVINFDEIITNTPEKLLLNVCSFLDALQKDKSIRINKYNKLVSTFADVLLENNILELDFLKDRFKVGLTTKSKEYNTFLEKWLIQTIHNKEWSLAEKIIDYSLDMKLKVSSVCLVAMSLPNKKLNEFLLHYLPQIETNESTIEFLLNTGSKFDTWSIKENPFFTKGLSLELHSKIATEHTVLLNAMYFVDEQIELKQLLNIAEMSNKLISYAANNSDIREFALLKMMVNSLCILLQKGQVSFVVDQLKQSYKTIGELEDWLDMVSQVYSSTGSDLIIQGSFLNELGPFIFDLTSLELNADASDRQKKRLIQSNFILLKSVYSFLSKELEWNKNLSALELEAFLPVKEREREQVHINDLKTQIDSIKVKIPLSTIQEIFDSTNELKRYTQFRIFSPKEGSKLYQP